MSILRTTTTLLAWSAVFLLASTASAQGHAAAYAHGSPPFAQNPPVLHTPLQPFNPVHFEMDAQPFAPAEISSFGTGPRAKVGFFASYERLYWTISKPPTANIGATPPSNASQFTPQGNSMDTDFLGAEWAWGTRFDLGYMDCTDYGWLVSIISDVSQNQQAFVANGQIVFEDPNGYLLNYVDLNQDGFDDDLNGNNVYGRHGSDDMIIGNDPPGDRPPSTIFPEDPIPGQDGIPDTSAPPDLNDRIELYPRYDNLKVQVHTGLNGVELMRPDRAPRLHHGGYFEVLYGVRYLRVDDRLQITGTTQIGEFEDPATTTAVSLFEQTFIQNTAANDIVGPQLGGRYFHQNGRWIFSMEGRFFAGVNFQTIQQKTRNIVFSGDPDVDVPHQSIVIPPPYYPFSLDPVFPYNVRNTRMDTVFAPGGELRVQTVYQVTKSFGLKLGYTAVYMNGVTRGSNRVTYSIPDMGIPKKDQHQNLFSNGISFGIELNR